MLGNIRKYSKQVTKNDYLSIWYATAIVEICIEKVFKEHMKKDESMICIVLEKSLQSKPLDLIMQYFQNVIILCIIETG